jgi:hypothetical protein
MAAKKHEYIVQAGKHRNEDGTYSRKGEKVLLTTEQAEAFKGKFSVAPDADAPKEPTQAEIDEKSRLEKIAAEEQEKADKEKAEEDAAQDLLDKEKKEADEAQEKADAAKEKADEATAAGESVATSVKMIRPGQYNVLDQNEKVMNTEPLKKAAADALVAKATV